MKIIQIRAPGGPETLEYAEMPKSEPGQGEVLVRARACGVGRVDVLIRRGIYHRMPPLPASPGNELAGEIEAVGTGVRELNIGDKVLVSARDLPQRGGCYADCIRVPAEAPHRLPATVDVEEAACLSNYQVAWALLHECPGPRVPQSILVIGAAGGIGSALVQLAKAAGIVVIGTVSSEAKAEFGRRMGADHVINYRDEDLFARTLALTEGRGVDVVFDHACGPNFPAYISLLADWGLLVSYNAFTPLPDRDLLSALRERADHCPAVRCFSFHVYDADVTGRQQITARLIELLAKGAIKPAIGARLPLREARKAHEMLEAGDTLGKILLIPEA